MPPENSSYAYAAYAAAFTVYTVYVISIWWRGRRLAARIRAAMGADRSAPPEP